MSEPQNGADLLARIKPQMREESTQICLRPDLLDEFEAADAELVKSRAADLAGNRLADGTSAKTRKLAEKVLGLQEQIDGTAITFRFKAMSKDRWRALCDAHPPRPKNRLDASVGYNCDAVLDEAVRLCLLDPVFDMCEKPECDHEACGSWEQLVKKLNPSEWNELTETVNSVNQGVVDAPKSVLASQILARRGNTSK